MSPEFPQEGFSRVGAETFHGPPQPRPSVTPPVSALLPGSFASGLSAHPSGPNKSQSFREGWPSKACNHLVTLSQEPLVGGELVQSVPGPVSSFSYPRFTW